MIQVTLEKKQKANKPFPKLMIGKGSYYGGIVLFFKYEEGTTVYPQGSVLNLGEFSNNWPMEYFEDYNEPITIQNA